ncbi:MAG: pseudouridine synthase [Bradyrhizobium sp.]|uniref:pseudouridine synthase n=1 Tax=Bradyrhizobium sp. TaxID=376 RepID=UPI0025C24A2E|nr:pseudouridine synthase [Bradyrhizobium sp.]MBI5261176.1 pseudouridine synthase [Bradyrhizobium sp.]
MPRDNDKDNDSRGRRDRAPRKGRSGVPRGPEKKFAKRGFAGKGDGDKPFAGKREGRPFRSRDEEAPRRDAGDRPRFKRDDRPRGDRPYADRSSRDGEKRSFKPRGDRPNFDRDDRAPRGRDRGESRPAGRFSEKKFGDKRPYAPRGERPERKFGDDRKFSRGADRPREDRNSARGDRAPRKDFGSRGRDRSNDFGGRERGDLKPWQKRDAGPREGRESSERPRFSRSRDDRAPGDRPFRDRPKFDRPREDRPKFDRPRRDREGSSGERGNERPKFDRPREDRPKFDRPRRDRDGERGEHGADHSKFDRPRQQPESRGDWQEHPRSEPRSRDRFADRPRRDNEDDSKVFAKRPAFGGRGAYRERKPDFDKRAPREEPKPKKTGERIAKVLARAGLASRRDAEEWVVQGRVTVNGRLINSPALDVTPNDVVAVDGKPLPPRERTRLFLYHKPRGLMTTHDDPEGRPTVFDNLPEGLPRLISIGRLDFNTEGLLLLTNDGGLARVLELPETGWLRRYRVRAHGEITQAQLDQLKNGIEVEGVKYGPIDATLERDQGANVWLVVAIREGKNREVRNVLAHLGLDVNRLIRVSYGPFQLGEIAEGEVDEVKTRVLREQLGEKLIAQAGAEFGRLPQDSPREEGEPSRDQKPFKPRGKSGLIEDRKGRRVLVQRTGSEEARGRNDAEAAGWGPPRRPKRGYHGKRDLKPREE